MTISRYFAMQVAIIMIAVTSCGDPTPETPQAIKPFDAETKRRAIMKDYRITDGSLKVAIAMLIGIAFESSFVSGLAAAQIAIAPPIEAVPFFALNAIYAVVFLPLLWWRHTAGYVGAIGVGAFSILTLSLVLSGSLGEFTPPNPLAPLTLFILAGVLIVFTIKAWRKRSSQVGGAS